MKPFVRTLGALLVALLALTVSGCDGEKAKETSSKGKSVELRFGWWGGDSRHEAYMATINRYMELNPNIKIVAEYGGWDGYKEKLYTQLAGGNAPQIFQNHYTWLGEQAAWQGNDVVRDLNKNKDLIDFSIFPKGFLEEYSIVDGKFMALPSSLNADAIVGNKALFEKAGIDYTKDWTFEDFFTANKKLKLINPEYYFENGMAASDIHMYWFLAYLVQKTGKPYTTNYTLSYDRATVVDAFKFIKRYFDEGVVESLGTLELYTGNSSQNPKWINGQSAILFGMLSTLETGVKAMGDNAKDAVVIKLPILSGAKDPYYKIKVGQVFSVAASATEDEAKEAIKFLNWTVTDKEAGKLLQLSRGIPISDAQKQALSDAGLISPLISQAEKYARDVGQGLGQDPLIRNNEISRIGADMIAKTAFGVISPEKAADTYIDLINSKLQEIKAKTN